MWSYKIVTGEWREVGVNTATGLSPDQSLKKGVCKHVHQLFYPVLETIFQYLDLKKKYQYSTDTFWDF